MNRVPPLRVTIFLVGALFMLLGLSGGVTIPPIILPIEETWARIAFFSIGALLDFVILYRPKRDSHPLPAPPTDPKDINLIKLSDPIPIYFEGQSQVTIHETNPMIIDFSNKKTWSGVALTFVRGVDITKYPHLNIKCMATKAFKLSVEYKVRVGNESKIVTNFQYQLVPATKEASVIRVPMKYDGKVNEIALMFYVTGESSRLSIESVSLSE